MLTPTKRELSHCVSRAMPILSKIHRLNSAFHCTSSYNAQKAENPKLETERNKINSLILIRYFFLNHFWIYEDIKLIFPQFP